MKHLFRCRFALLCADANYDEIYKMAIKKCNEKFNLVIILALIAPIRTKRSGLTDRREVKHRKTNFCLARLG